MPSLNTYDVYAIGAPIILVMIAIEVCIDLYKSAGLYQGRDTLASMGLLAGNILGGTLIKGGALVLSLAVYQYRLFDLSSSLPLWAQWALTFILIDFVFYFYHRLSHRVRFLWAIHMNHHSSEQMNFVVAFRQAWFGPVSKIPFFIVLPLIGLDPTITIVAGVISTLWGVIGHTQIIKSMGSLEWILNTPSHHRVHHGSNPEYIDKNYGNLLIIWDRLFGTFAKEQAAVVFGLVSNVNTFNPVTITFMAWRSLFYDMRNASSAREALSYFVGPPEWKPTSHSGLALEGMGRKRVS